MSRSNESRSNAEHDDPDIAGRDEKLFKMFLGHTGAPAFMRRAQRVTEAEEHLLAHCRAQRNEWLTMARTRLGMLRSLCTEFENLTNCVTPNGIVTLQDLERLLEPPSYPWLKATTARSALKLAVTELNDSLRRFNQRWLDYLQQVDLTEVNQLREKYNCYYVLEKECITRSPRLARQGFTPLAALTHAQLIEQFPRLPVVEVREDV